MASSIEQVGHHRLKPVSSDRIVVKDFALIGKRPVGSASERSLDLLRENVRQGYISIEGAWNNYSVRFDPKSLEVIERRA